ncbi:T9SS type A sorting domain-containing protein [Neolewinella agarilytica]|uniref:Por secretion system C-terminal sorting domain-containing protein n=1 Tax=Neolewinella agarilytica TaxID=478744 RepID=A0A1H9B8Q3_9BACT|nr:T9SS type A sorting domain-containing protein [Neolewinella agarilytica]SEP84618.1 Por secretion system C-terminal sorting domain-containing protein [Neolewinella agarilytica]
MKHLLLTIIIFSLCVSSLTAQFDYQLFRPGVQYLYERYSLEPENYHDYPFFIESPIVGMKTDARTCQPLFESFYSSHDCGPGPSFAGYAICQSSDSTIMHMGGSEYFRLQTQDQIGSSWTAGRIGGVVAIGKITSIDTMSFLGLMDTAKTITFHHPETDTLLGPPIIISKNYGLISAAWFGRMEDNRSMPLRGLSNPKVGLQNFTDEEVFDISAGDVFHFTIDDWFSPFARLAVSVTSVEKTESFVKISYTGSRIDSQTFYRNGEMIDTFYLREVNSNWYFGKQILDMLRKQPGESYAPTGGHYHTAHLFRTDGCRELAKRHSVEMKPLGEGRCYLNGSQYDATPSLFFFPGFAGAFGESTFFLPFGRELIYANTAAGECGTPLNIEEILSGLRADESEETIAFQVYPNPGREAVNLTLPETELVDLQLIDPLGRKVFSQAGVRGSLRIDTSKLPAGAFLLLLRKNGRVVGSKRLILR